MNPPTHRGGPDHDSTLLLASNSLATPDNKAPARPSLPCGARSQVQHTLGMGVHISSPSAQIILRCIASWRQAWWFCMLVFCFLILDCVPLGSHLVPHFLAHETGESDTEDVTTSLRMKTILCNRSFMTLKNLGWSFSLS